MSGSHDIQESSGRHQPSARVQRYAVGPTLAVLFCPAPNGKLFGVTIDKDDLPRVLAAGFWRVWNFRSGRSGFALYCYASKKGGGVLLLHRFITNAPAGIQIDHAHHRTLDNRGRELRLADQYQQSRNTRPRRDSRTGFRGVTQNGPNSFRARLWANGEQRINIGFYPTAEAAARAYDEAAKKYHGAFAYLNFPKEIF